MGSFDLSRARAEATARLAAQDQERMRHAQVVDEALRKQDVYTRSAVADFLRAVRDDRKEPTVGRHFVWSRYENECTTRTICVLRSGHVLFSKGDHDSAAGKEVESFGDYWRRGETCCNGEIPFQLSRGQMGYPQLGHRDPFWESWPAQEVARKIEQTTAWFVRALAEYLAKRDRS
jgi:hypothetical protein